MLFWFSKKEAHLKPLGDIAEMFNLFANHDWHCVDDPGKKNLAHAICQCVLEDFLEAVS